MDKKKLIIAAAGIVLIMAAVFVYFDTKFINKAAETALKASSAQTQAATIEGTAVSGTLAAVPGDSLNSGEITTVQTSSLNEGTGNLRNDEKVEVGYNTPEYDLSLDLCESSDNRTFIRLQYYLNGTTEVNELDEGDLPELAGIFEKRAEKSGSSEDSATDKNSSSGGSKNGSSGNSDTSKSGNSGNVTGYKISQALLNPVHSQLYLLIQGGPFDAFAQSSFYMVDLNDMSVKKLFSYLGLYGRMAFNKDFSLLAWSFGDPPVMSVHLEDNLLEVFDCSAGDYIVKGNLYSNGKILGSNCSPDLLYDYELETWQSVDILKLKQAVRPLRSLDSALTQTEVLYNVKKNLLLNLDGSAWKYLSAEVNPTQAAGKAGSGTNATTGSAAGTTSGAAAGTGELSGEQKADSEPVKVLRSFYSYLGSENNYSKAMQLLDGNFKLRLQMLKQFGADELVKSDIDAENASLYSELLKTAKFDSLSKEITKGNTSTIEYFQLLGVDPANQEKQHMTAMLKKSDNKWKIILIEDGLQ